MENIEDRLLKKPNNGDTKDLSACSGGFNYFTCNDGVKDEAASKSAKGFFDEVKDTGEECESFRARNNLSDKKINYNQKIIIVVNEQSGS